MSLRHIVFGAGSSGPSLNVSTVFASNLFTNDLTVNNGINLSANGGLVIGRNRYAMAPTEVWDTARGAASYMMLNSTYQALYSPTYLTSFNTNGYTVGYDSKTGGQSLGSVGWTFRKAAKFFDVLTYTGNGSNRTISHSLGQTPGMVIVKCHSSAGNWQVYHNGLTSAAYGIKLNLTNAQASDSTLWNSTAPTSSVFSLGTSSDVNANGSSYVAYLFAHDPSGVIQCVSFTTDSSGNGTYNHGWSNGVQFVMLKAASGIGNWEAYDTARTPSFSGDDARLILQANDQAEDSVARIATSGTSLNFSGLSASATYVALFVAAP